MRTKKRIPEPKLLIMLFILALSLIPAQAQETDSCEAATGEALVLGAIFPQDVLLLSDTSEWWRGTEAMTAAINACGGVNGRPVEYRYEEAATYEDALTAFDSLAADNVPLIVASGFAPVNEGLMLKAAEDGVVLWEVTERPAESSNPWTFYAHPSEAEVGAELAQYVQENLIPSLGIDEPRLALISETRPRASAIAEGFRDALAFAPIMDESYENDLGNAYPLSVQMREQEVNILIMISFHNDADRLWNAMLQADANVSAWLHLGGEDYHNTLDWRIISNSEGMLLAGANGLLLNTIPDWIDSAIYEAYLNAYEESYDEAPNRESNLSALGVYILLHHLLPQVDSDSFSAENIHAIMETNPRGSWWQASEAAVYVQQNQRGEFCVLAPSLFSNCRDSVQPFPTWRERVRDS